MSSLSDLLNPAPAGDTSAEETRNNDITPLQIPNPYQLRDTAHDNPDANGPFVTRDAAYSLTALSTNSDNAPTPGEVTTNTIMQSPVSHQDGTRRQSLYGESGTQLPNPNDMIRKMSSPTLEQFHFQSRSPEARRVSGDGPSRKMSSPGLDQYHVASRSPEQRRGSILAQHPAFTLAPLQPQPQSQPGPAQEKGDHVIGTDTSHVIPVNENITGGQELKTDSKSTVIQREPSYTRNEPATSQIRGAEVSPSAQGTDLLHTVPADRRGSLTTIKTESGPSIHSSIPTFVPVPSVKREQSNSLREGSVPLPTTEGTPTREMKGKKRPAPKSVNKKGIAKKGGPPTKKRKTEVDATKSKPRGPGGLKKGASASATPLDSSPAPRSARTGSSPSQEPDGGLTDGDEMEDEEEPGTPGPDDDVYCLCRRPDTGTFMIGCDGGCDDWFHGKCVGIEEKKKGLIDRYICPNCEKRGIGVTTWKRMCRRQGCNAPARIGKKGVEGPSKYCSEECGLIFWQAQVKKTRTSVEKKSGRYSKKKSSASADHDNDDLGPHGGILSAGELKALVDAAPDIDAFKRLGEGVLSPPATPAPNDTKTEDTNQKAKSGLLDTEDERAAEIVKGKQDLRERHSLLKDRIKFITMLKQRSTHIAEKNGMRPKEMCGFDSRVNWSDEEFAQWRSSKVGAEALINERFSDEHSTSNGEVEMMDTEEQVETCTKRKCARHFDWSKLQLDHTRFEITINGDAMRELDKEEKDVLERASLRARELKAGNVGGSVEIHEHTQANDNHATAGATTVDLPISSQIDARDEDTPMASEAAVSLDGITDAARSATEEHASQDMTTTGAVPASS